MATPDPLSLRLILVEDDADDAELLGYTLREDGLDFSLSRVEDEAGLERALAGEPDLIIADYRLPKLSAEQLLTRLQERRLDLPVIILSGAIGEERVAELVRLGARDFCSKRNQSHLPRLIRREVADRARRLQQRTAEQRLQLLSSIVEQSHSVVLVLGRDGAPRYANPALCRLAGVDGVSPDLPDRLWPADDPSLRESRNRVFRTDLGDGPIEDILTARNHHGERIHLRATLLPLRDENGDLSGTALVAQDVSAQLQVEQRLLALTLSDPLTGLPNRQRLEDRLAQAMARAAQHGGVAALAVIRIQEIRDIHASHGPRATDTLVRTLAERLRDTVARNELLARIGTDEFAVLLQDDNGVEALSARVGQLVAACQGPAGVEADETLYLTARAGVAVYPGDGDSAEAMLHHAASAVRAAIEAPHDTGIRFFRTGLDSAVRERIRLATQVRRAVAEGEFVLAYQPIFDSVTGHRSSVEALLRWNRPGHGLVSPAEFLPVLEQVGLLPAVERWVLRSACEQQRQWHDAGFRPGRIHVNVSAAQIAQPDVVPFVATTLRQTGCRGDALGIEITETAFLEDRREIRRNLKELRELGVKVSLDDFGSGFSGFAYLRYLLVDAIKIDRQFIASITRSEGDAAITQAIVSLARGLGLAVVAEGVEQQEQWAFLRRLGCTAVQGYWCGRPILGDDFREHSRGQLPATSEAEETGHGPAVLVVDDEPNVLKALARLLRREPWRVLTAESPEAALKMMAQTSVQVLLTDQRMPGLSGLDLVKRVRQIHPATVRMIMSAHADISTMTAAINEGAVFRFIPKPWDPEQLRRDIREAVILAGAG
jgi:diguanylate cyclase (GGDEF)-like protein/PAS domain S-box-containing protein